MSTRAGQVGQWALFAGALVCAILFIVLIDTAPTVTYTLPEDEDQQVVAECNNSSWGAPDRNEFPIGEGRSRTHHRIVKGEDAYQQAQDELREQTDDAASAGINEAQIEDDCLRANGLREHQLMWTGFGGLLLIGAGGYVDLRRRRPHLP